MFRNVVVVGVDGSSESLRAAAVARRIADAAGVKLQVTYAVPDAQLAQMVGRAQRGLVARLRGIVPAATLRTLDVGSGRAAHVLAKSVARCRAGLVVLGGKRHGRLARAFGGSTAHYLARVLDIPVLVTATTSIERVLIAVDLSAAAERTLATGIALAQALGAQVRVLHVVEPIRYTYVVPRAPDIAAFLVQSKGSLGRLVHRFGMRTLDTVVRRGTATDAIITEAVRWRATLIVVGSHGKGFVDRALIGSTAESLLDRLPASLLIVPVVRGKAGRSKRVW